MRKWILLAIYLGVWILLLPPNVPGYIVYDKTSYILLGFFLVLMFGPPCILFFVLSEFGVSKKKRKAILYASMTLLFPYVLWMDKLDENRLKESSIQTKGVVYDKWTSKRRKLLRAKFIVDYDLYITSSKNDVDDIFEIGDTVTIRYWTENPGLCSIVELEK